MAGLKEIDIDIPQNITSKWVVDCQDTGKGISAIKYLSRYLYRGVISEKNIVSNYDGFVTFKYVDSKSGATKYRKLKGEDFLQLIMKHILPSGFRRIRDYGFLHGNAKKASFSHSTNIKGFYTTYHKITISFQVSLLSG
ncbi:MAG: transposase [Desulfotalea sp.]